MNQEMSLRQLVLFAIVGLIVSCIVAPPVAWW